MYQENMGDHYIGWSQSPTIRLSKDVLGILVPEARSREIKIEPYSDNIKGVEDRYPTLPGDICARQNNSKIKVP